MIRRLVIRLIALLLIVNGLAGVTAAWIGWRVTADLVAGLRESGASLTAQQTRLVESVRGVAVGVDDASQAADGLSRSTTRVRTSLADATQTANQLASTFDRLSQASQVSVFGARPLEGLTEPFSANAADFRQLSVSLGETGSSLADNVREMARVRDDLKSIEGQLRTVAVDVEALQSATVIERGLAGLELGSRLLLGMIFFESTLSALTGLALLIMLGYRTHWPTTLALAGPADDGRERAAQHGTAPRDDPPEA